MQRTDEFFTYLSNNHENRDLNKLLKSRASNPFNEASETIANTIISIESSIDETAPSYIDKYNAIPSLSSSMDDEQRKDFIKQTNNSINHVEHLITELADNVNSGKMGLKGQAIDHSQGVFQHLDQSLNRVRFKLQSLQLQRKYVLERNKAEVPMQPLSLPKMKARYTKTTEVQKPRLNEPIPSNFERSLLQEYDNIIDDMLDLNSHLNVTDEQLGNIAMMVKSFNELISHQNDRIRIIKSDVVKAQANYEESKNQIHKTIDRTKFQHLWMAIVITILGIMLLIKS